MYNELQKNSDGFIFSQTEFNNSSKIILLKIIYGPNLNHLTNLDTRMVRSKYVSQTDLYRS